MGHTPTAASFIPAMKKDRNANASLAMLPLGRHHRCTTLPASLVDCASASASPRAVRLSGSEMVVSLLPVLGCAELATWCLSGSCGAVPGQTSSAFLSNTVREPPAAPLVAIVSVALGFPGGAPPRGKVGGRGNDGQPGAKGTDSSGLVLAKVYIVPTLLVHKNAVLCLG